jgi:hypothetical protein
MVHLRTELIVSDVSSRSTNIGTLLLLFGDKFYYFAIAFLPQDALRNTSCTAQKCGTCRRKLMDLFTGNPDQVASARRLSFFVDNPPREMQIFSGIAIPMWDSQLKLDYADVFVHFEIDAPPGTINVDWEYTATISLASIGSDGEEDFTYATDECELAVHPGNNELMLKARIGVLGEPAVLYRFSYHVEVISKLPIVGAVFGTIRWNQMYGAPSQKGSAPMFKVGPATYNAGGGLGAGGAKAGWNWDPDLTVLTNVAPINAAGEWAVPYALTGLPLDQPLNITPDLLDGALVGPPSPFQPLAAFAPPSHLITLTAATPSVVGADFEMTFPVVA